MQSWRGEVCAVSAGWCVLSPSCSILLLTLEGQLIRELYNCHPDVMKFAQYVRTISARCSSCRVKFRCSLENSGDPNT